MIIDLLQKSIPEYTVFLPDSKKSYQYRPMLVKEEKFISIITSIKSEFSDKLCNLCLLVNSCFNNKLDSIELTITDFQIALNSIRQKSISEISSFKMSCPETNERVDVQLDLSSFAVSDTDQYFDIKINKEFLLKFKKPQMKDLLILDDYPQTESDWFSLISNSLVEIITSEEKILTDSVDLNEKIKYIELLSKKDFNQIKKFIKSNSIKFNINYTLSNGDLKEIEVNDFTNFLKFFMVILTL